MNLLVIHPHFHRRRTGVTRHVESLIESLNREGVEIEARGLGRELSPSIPMSSWTQLWSRAGAGAVVWHAHRVSELWFGLLLRWLRPKLKVVFTRHAATPPSRLTRALANQADARVSLTEEVAEQLRLTSTIVGHGVDLKLFRPPDNRARAWAELGLGGTSGIGVIGRVREAKGQGDFAEAIAPLLSRFPDWRAVLVGAARGSDAAFADALRNRCSGALVLAGEQRDVLPWYRGLSIVVQPSHSEGFSLVLLEALASGCCVVAARLPHFSRWIEHRRTGFLYEPGDVAELGRLLGELLADPGEVERVGREAAIEAQRRMGMQAETAALTEIYRRLAVEGS